jgi:hypothetical protein
MDEREAIARLKRGDIGGLEVLGLGREDLIQIAESLR